MDLKALRLQKSAANLQRRWRESYLAGLRPELADYLVEFPFVTAPETDALAARFGVADTGEAPNGLGYSEVYWPADALRLVAALPTSESPAWLMPGGYSAPAGYEHCAAFEVPFVWAQRHVDALWAEHHGWGRPAFNLVSQDGSVGVLIEEWGAFPEDNSPSDVVYGVRRWPVHKHAS